MYSLTSAAAGTGLGQDFMLGPAEREAEMLDVDADVAAAAAAAAPL